MLAAVIAVIGKSYKSNLSSSTISPINFGTIFGARKLFSKKYTHAGSIVNTTLPACYIYHFTLQIHKSSAQNYQNAEDTALLYYIEAQKIAAELAAKSKYFLCSNHRTLEALKHKSAATLSIIAATFCSIIIETHL